MKKLIAMTVALGFCLGFIKAVEAAQLTVTIRPSANYSLTLASATSIDLGTVAMGASTQTVIPATITITSTYANTDISVEGEIAVNWNLDTTSDTIEQDLIAVWAVFTTTNTDTAPTQTGGYFNGSTLASGSDLVGDAARYGGTAGANADLFEANGEADLEDLDNMNPNEQAHLWLWFRMPSVSTSSGEHYIQIIVSASPPQA